jgi:hypothetical protein
MKTYDIHLQCLGKRKQFDIIWQVDNEGFIHGAEIIGESHSRIVGKRIANLLATNHKEEINSELFNVMEQEEYFNDFFDEEYIRNIHAGINY